MKSKSVLTYSAKRALQDLRVDPVEGFLKILHRLRILSVRHTFSVFYSNIQKQDVLDEVWMKEVREIYANELQYLNFEESLHSKDSLEKHFAAGYRFWAYFLDGQVVALNGVHESRMDLVYLKRPVIYLPPKTVYINHAITAKPYRRRGIGAKLRKCMMTRLCDEGYERAVLVSFKDKGGANAWHEANGFKKWGDASYLKMPGFEFQWDRMTKWGKSEPNLLKTHFYRTKNKREVTLSC